jgi:hypothetical protein
VSDRSRVVDAGISANEALRPAADRVGGQEATPGQSRQSGVAQIGLRVSAPSGALEDFLRADATMVAGLSGGTPGRVENEMRLIRFAEALDGFARKLPALPAFAREPELGHPDLRQVREPLDGRPEAVWSLNFPDLSLMAVVKFSGAEQLAADFYRDGKYRAGNHDFSFRELADLICQERAL